MTLPAFPAMMGPVAYCDRCEMSRDYCVHGWADKRQALSGTATLLLISPNNVAHFPECPHKGDDPIIAVGPNSTWRSPGTG